MLNNVSVVEKKSKKFPQREDLFSTKPGQTVKQNVSISLPKESFNKGHAKTWNTARKKICDNQSVQI